MKGHQGTIHTIQYCLMVTQCTLGKIGEQTKSAMEDEVSQASFDCVDKASYRHIFFLLTHTHASNFPSSAHNMPPCVHTHTHTLNPVWMAWTQKTPNWSVVAATEQRVMEWGMEFKATRHAGPCGDNSQQTLWPVPVTVLSGFRDKKMHTYWHLGMKDIFLVFLLSLSLS